MRPLAGHADIGIEPKGRRARDQAPGAALVMALLILGACADTGRMPAIGGTLARAFGPATEGREPAPGLDDPYPNLGTVPGRPAQSPLAQRQAITDALAVERARAAMPRSALGSQAPAGSAARSQGGVPFGPPPAAVLGSAPPIAIASPPARQGIPPGPASPSLARPAGTTGAPTAPAMTPAQTPVLTPALAPPPPPPPSIMVPGAAPPPPPAPDLLAPPRTR